MSHQCRGKHCRVANTLLNIVKRELKNRHPDYTFTGSIESNPFTPYTYLQIMAIKENPTASMWAQDTLTVYTYEIPLLRQPSVYIVSGSAEDRAFIEDSWDEWIQEPLHEVYINRKNANYPSNRNYKNALKNKTKLKRDGGKRRTRRRA